MNATRLHNAGQAVSYSWVEHALPSDVLGRIPSLGRSAACFAPHTADGAWDTVRSSLERRRGADWPLRVGILGCSTTAGCGALSPSPRCSLPLSWGRRFTDALSGALQSASPAGVLPQSADVSIFHKNAVEGSYFTSCLKQMLSARADIVLLELLQNQYFGMHRTMNLTVAGVRRAAPNAAIALLGWVKPGKGGLLAEARGIALAIGIDLIDVNVAAHTLGYTAGRLYAVAKNGRVDHHPSPLGHELLGALSASCVVGRLRGADDRAAIAGRARGHGHGAARNSSGRAGGGRGRQGNQASATEAEAEAEAAPEACYNSAAEVPVVTAVGGHARNGSRTGLRGGGGSERGRAAGGGGFMMVDDGAEKGVPKLGWASSTLRERITLGPLHLHPPRKPPASLAAGGGGGGDAGAGGGVANGSSELFAARCYQDIQIRLGYLVSTHAGHGALLLRCAGGCACRPIKSKFLRQAMPFPRLEASARGSSEVDLWGTDENVTMTAYTNFVARLAGNASDPNPPTGAHAKSKTSCYVHADHVASRVPSAGGSRVRIDSLALMVHGSRNVVPCWERG